jgi:uncharacterized membrane protein YsdA (DUF1294 family)
VPRTALTLSNPASAAGGIDDSSSKERAMTTFRRIHIAAALLLLAVALGISGMLVWNMTTSEQFGPPGHFPRTVQHQIYPHRAEALWAMAAFFGAVGALLGTARRGPASLRPH